MIFQSALPYDVFAQRPLPGIMPLGDRPWFLVDDAYAGQMAYRRALVSEKPGAVLATANPGAKAQQEMLADILTQLPDGFVVSDTDVICPDGTRVALDRSTPFLTLARILQDDICLLEKRGDEHVLTGAALCFPASWQLSEKIGHPLTHIHGPVSDYTDVMAKRVQRLFDGVRPGHALWRFNALWYDDPDLHQPRSVSAPRAITDQTRAPYLRSERQVIWRLPESGAVLFTIHTFVVPRAVLCPAPSQEAQITA
ncbi:heme-dependent oxidative N-demethylase family protein [Marivita sp. S0852]|uniref:heme-dependent oxidative N-demethylase family protein n=1 Tax=Marivita sp. S0852 TaxID=3373893 RepID=UPI0039827F63